MILIIESGSTKADWVCLDNSGAEIDRWSIMGFNPYFHSANFISQTLLKHPEIRQIKESVDQVWFYGAGCSSCLLYTSPSPRDRTRSRMPSSA